MNVAGQGLEQSCATTPGTAQHEWHLAAAHQAIDVAQNLDLCGCSFWDAARLAMYRGRASSLVVTVCWDRDDERKPWQETLLNETPRRGFSRACRTRGCSARAGEVLMSLVCVGCLMVTRRLLGFGVVD